MRARIKVTVASLNRLYHIPIDIYWWHFLVRIDLSGRRIKVTKSAYACKHSYEMRFFVNVTFIAYLMQSRSNVTSKRDKMAIIAIAIVAILDETAF